MTLAMSNLGVPELLIISPLILAIFAFWLWMLIDAIKNPRLTSTERLIWVLVIIFVHTLGAVIYYFAGRTKQA